MHVKAKLFPNEIIFYNIVGEIYCNLPNPSVDELKVRAIVLSHCLLLFCCQELFKKIKANDFRNPILYKLKVLTVVCAFYSIFLQNKIIALGGEINDKLPCSQVNLLFTTLLQQ